MWNGLCCFACVNWTNARCGSARQYFFVVFKDKPMQLWDLRGLTVIREMSRSFPNISALVCVCRSLLVSSYELGKFDVSYEQANNTQFHLEHYTVAHITRTNFKFEF